jgi:hypothetical protein
VTLIDELIHETYLEVLDTSNDQVVTVIELLSPANTVAGAKGQSIDYTREPVPPLKPEWALWSDRLLREKRLRRSE